MSLYLRQLPFMRVTWVLSECWPSLFEWIEIEEGAGLLLFDFDAGVDVRSSSTVSLCRLDLASFWSAGSL